MTEKMDLSVLYKVTVFDRCPGVSSGADVSDSQISEASSASILDGSTTSQQMSHGTDGLTWELVPLNAISRADNQGEQSKEGTPMDPLLSCDQMEVELVPLDVELVPVEIQLVPAEEEEEEEPPVAIELVPVEEGCGTFSSQPPADSFTSIETYNKMLSDKDPMFTAASTPYQLKYQENLRDSFSLASAEGEGLGLDDAMVESLLKDGSLPIIEDVMGSEFTSLSNAERQKTGASGGGTEEKRPKSATNSAESPLVESEQESLRRKPRQTRKQQQLIEQSASTKFASKSDPSAGASTNTKPSGGKGNDASKSHSSPSDDVEAYPEHAASKTRQVRSGASHEGEQKSAGKRSFSKQSEAEATKSKLPARRKTVSVEEPPLFVPDNLPPAVKKESPKDHNAKSGNAKVGKIRSQKLEEESSTDLTETMSSALSDESDSENDPNKLWCICRQPYNNRFMICCDRCEDWFHGDCVGITVSRGRQMERNGEDYICPNCSSKEDESKQASGSDQDVQLGVKPGGTTLSDSDAGTTQGKGAPPQAAMQGTGDGPIATNTQQGNIKGKIEKAKIVTDITKKKRILNRCAGTGCTKMAAPGSVYCSNDCILRHAAHTMQTLQKGQAKPVPLASVTRDPSSSVQPPATRLDANPALRRNSSDKPVVVFERSNRVVLIKTNVISLPKPGGLVKQPQPATNFQLGSKANIPSSTFHNAANKQKTDFPANNRKETVAKEKKPELKRKVDTPAPAAPNDKLIRRNVRRSLGEIFAKRMKDTKSLKISEDEAMRVADEIERELYAQFQDTDSKYKNKYRSLMFNLKDVRNHGLFRRVLKREISPRKLVRMSPEELASKELAEWRERENKHTLEMIEKEQREIERRPITKITHKGEIEIEESTLQSAVEKSTDSEPLLNEETETKIPVDTTEQHKFHLFDLNCKICTGKVAPPVEEPSAKKVKVATSVILAAKRAGAESESTSGTVPLPSKADAGTAKSAVSVIASPSVNAIVEEPLSKSPVSVVTVRLAEQSAGDCRAFSFLDDIWKGFVNMQNVAKFATKVFAVSGSCDHMAEDLPDTIEVGGRIAPKVVWDYLEKVKATVTKEVCLLRFYPATEEEKVGYVSLFSYFSSRNRFGVVANNCPYVKDMYLIPLGAYDDLPENLLPLDGPGLEQTRPNMLLGLVVRQRSKRRLPGEHPFDAPILYDKEHTVLNSPDDKQKQVRSFDSDYHHSVSEKDSIGRSSKYSEESGNSTFVDDGISPLMSMYSANTTSFYGTSDYAANSLPLPPSTPPYVPENNAIDPIVQNFATLDDAAEEEEHNTNDDEAYDPEDETLFTDNTRRFGQSSGMLSVRDKPPDMSMEAFLDTIVSPANVSLSEQQLILENLNRQIAEEKRKLEEQEASLRQIPPLLPLPGAVENVDYLSIQVNKSRDPRQSGFCKQVQLPNKAHASGSLNDAAPKQHESGDEGATEARGKDGASSQHNSHPLSSRHDVDPKKELRDPKQPSSLSHSEKWSTDSPSEPSGSGNSYKNLFKDKDNWSRRDSSELRSQQGSQRRSSNNSGSDRGVEERDRHERKNSRDKGGHTEQRWDRERDRQRGRSDERDRRRGWDSGGGGDKDWGRDRDRDRERSSSERSRSNRDRPWNRGRDYESRDAGRSRDRDRSRSRDRDRSRH